MQTALKIKLSFFMFLQYFIWGSWYVSMGTYLANVLKFSGQEIGAAYGAFAIGSMISPFFVGLIADRYFASEKMLAVLGILGGGVLCALPHVAVFKTLYPTLILYCALYAPTLALGNSLSLHHLLDSKNDFPRVKIFSAVGWIAGGVTLSFLNGEQSPSQFYLAGAASILLGLIWGVWHYPAFKIPGMPQGAFNFPLFVAGAMVLTVIVAWLVLRTGGSVLIAVLFHLAVNTSLGAFQPPFSMFVLVLAIVAGAILLFDRGFHKTDKNSFVHCPILSCYNCFLLCQTSEFIGISKFKCLDPVP